MFMRTTFRKFFVLLILFLCPPTAWAQVWEFKGWSGGGCYPNIEFDPKVKGRVYLTSDVTGLWRSNNYGDNWFFVTKGLGNLLVAQIAIAPSDSNVLYAATTTGVFVSRDGAQTWTKAGAAESPLVFARPINYRPIAVDPVKPSHVCAGTSKGKVFCSTDYGTSWTDMDPSKSVFSDEKAVRAMKFDPTGTTLYVGFGRGVGRCDVTKPDCVFLSSGPAKVMDMDLSKNVLYVAGDTAVWYSQDKGESWQKTAPVPQGTTDRVEVESSSSPPTIRVVWISGWNGGVYLSKDMGKSWKGQDTDLAGDKVSNPTRIWAKPGGRTTSLKVDPFDPSVVFRTDWWGVWRSDNGGASWKEKVDGAPNTVITDIALDPKGQIYATSMDNGLLRSSDDGKTYEALFPKTYDINLSGHVWGVELAGSNIIATSSPWDKKINQVVVSKDGGASFSVVQDGLPDKRPVINTMWGEGYPRGLAVDPKNSNIVYLGIDGDDEGGLFVSKNGGLSWQRSAGQPGSKRIYYGLAVDPTDSNRIVWGASGSGGGVYVSADAGKTFKYAMGQMQWVFDVAIGPDGSMYAAGDSGGAKLYVSRNHGVKWSLLKSFETSRALGSVAVHPKNAALVAVSTVSWNNSAPNKIYLSKDSGKTWTDVTGMLPEGSGAATLTFDPVNNYLYAGRMAGSVYRLRL
jgi:photosystem II stability/assembly factor-like uncharacterized protein